MRIGTKAISQNPNSTSNESVTLGSLVCLPGIEAKPSDNPCAGIGRGLLKSGLPTVERRQPNPQSFSKLPLREAKFMPLFVEVFADGLGVGRANAAQLPFIRYGSDTPKLASAWLGLRAWKRRT
jgi:hypothetical protein